LDHGQITGSDFRTAILQASLHMKSDEAQRAAKRSQDMAAQQQAQLAQAEARFDQQQAVAQGAKQAKETRRQAMFQQIIRNNQIEEEISERQTAAFMNATSNLLGNFRQRQPTICSTTVMGNMASTFCN
jgi:hypothetical protein